jgi:ketosteroid isomerase-like protein
MKNLLCVIFLALLLCFSFSCQHGNKAKKEDIGAVGEQIKQFVKEWAEASNTDDLDRIMSMVADNCVRIPPNAPPLIGKEVIRKDQQQFFDLYTSKGD